ncbi:MAG: diacylglycerol kinase [Actinobacteria bacterium]|nr:MAG: diacylglycerol kinase [Actinomycetota bacterium]RIK04629.1 MAG: diacylglycerol kinase [Acidobacteriota bacterium]
MVYRVIQWATGTVGIHAVPAIVRHPDLELVGLWVHSDSKVGRDAGEICGTAPVGVTATDDAEALLATEADVISYMASSDIRPAEVVEDLCRMLSAGFNVVNTSFVPLLFPWAAGEGVAEQLQAACSDGGTSIYTSGIDPGFANVQLPISAMSLCERVDSVRVMEIVNYATWDNPFTLFEIMGFGKPDESESLLLAPGSLRLAWGPVVETIAAALGTDLDEIVEQHEVIRAEEAFEIASGKIDAGTISGMRFEIQGIVSGRPAIVVEHVTRMRDEDAPHWPQGHGYRVQVDGEPHLGLDLSLGSARGDHNTAGCLATAMSVLNAVPHVVEAEPGIVTALDLPLYTATGLLS